MTTKLLFLLNLKSPFSTPVSFKCFLELHYYSSQNISSTTVTLQWNPITCSSQSSSLTGYVVRYGSGLIAQTEVNTSSIVDMYIVIGLTPFTLYTFQVAGVCGEDIGQFSTAIRLMTAEDSEL